MKRPTKSLCLFILLAGIGLASCGGGGGNVPGGNMGGNLVASFTPSNPTPGANSISMLAGTATGDTFQVVIGVTDIADFFGAAFRVNFDDTSAEFLSFDDSMSFLNGVGPVVDIRATVDPLDPGAVLVVATLQQPFGYADGIPLDPMNPTRTLLELTFRATDPTAGNAFTLGTAATREVTTCPQWNMMGLPPDCPEIPDAMLNWGGGMLTAN